MIAEEFEILFRERYGRAPDREELFEGGCHEGQAMLREALIKAGRLKPDEDPYALI